MSIRNNQVSYVAILHDVIHLIDRFLVRFRCTDQTFSLCPSVHSTPNSKFCCVASPIQSITPFSHLSSLLQRLGMFVIGWLSQRNFSTTWSPLIINLTSTWGILIWKREFSSIYDLDASYCTTHSSSQWWSLNAEMLQKFIRMLN